MEIASAQAIDVMVRELLTDENYNNKFDEIENYLTKNVLKCNHCEPVGELITLEKFKEN